MATRRHSIAQIVNRNSTAVHKETITSTLFIWVLPINANMRTVRIVNRTRHHLGSVITPKIITKVKNTRVLLIIASKSLTHQMDEVSISIRFTKDSDFHADNAKKSSLVNKLWIITYSAVTRYTLMVILVFQFKSNSTV